MCFSGVTEKIVFGARQKYLPWTSQIIQPALCTIHHDHETIQSVSGLIMYLTYIILHTL